MSITHHCVVPSFRYHKPSGQAVVTINGQDFYLGPWNSADSRAEYDRRLAAWLACGRQLPPSSSTSLTVSEMLVPYWRFAKQHYRKHGQPSRNYGRRYSRSVFRLCTIFLESADSTFGTGIVTGHARSWRKPARVGDAS